MATRTKIVSAGVGALALAGVVALGAGGAGIAFADDPSTTPSANPTADATPSGSSGPTSPRSSAPGTAKTPAEKGAAKHKRDLLRRTLHGEVTVGGARGTRVIDLQRGTVTAVSSSSITVRSADGFRGTYVVVETTRVRKDGEKAAIGAIRTGDQVRVTARRDGSTKTATLVVEPKAR